MRHILSHTTGIPSAGFNALIERGASPLEAQEEIQNITLEEEPGKKFAYHNVVYNLLTDVVENHSGTSFESVLQEKLLKPLHMTGTSSTWEAFISEENRVAIHVVKKAKGKKGKTIKTGRRASTLPKRIYKLPSRGGVQQ